MKRYISPVGQIVFKDDDGFNNFVAELHRQYEIIDGEYFTSPTEEMRVKYGRNLMPEYKTIRFTPGCLDDLPDNDKILAEVIGLQIDPEKTIVRWYTDDHYLEAAQFSNGRLAEFRYSKAAEFKLLLGSSEFDKLEIGVVELDALLEKNEYEGTVLDSLRDELINWTEEIYASEDDVKIKGTFGLPGVKRRTTFVETIKTGLSLTQFKQELYKLPCHARTLHGMGYQVQIFVQDIDRPKDFIKAFRLSEDILATDIIIFYGDN